MKSHKRNILYNIVIWSLYIFILSCNTAKNSYSSSLPSKLMYTIVKNVFELGDDKVYDRDNKLVYTIVKSVFELGDDKVYDRDNKLVYTIVKSVFESGDDKVYKIMREEKKL